MKLNFSRGFTLTELLVVIAIIGLLAAIVLASINRAREKAQVAKAVLEVKETVKLFSVFYDDTGTYPAACGPLCVSGDDPFLNDLGVPGWKGPYGSLYDRAHPWGGHFGVTDAYDIDSDGILDQVIWLNDDRPGTGDADNGGLIPTSALLGIDRIIDDGNLTTGNMREWVAGEAMIKITQ